VGVPPCSCRLSRTRRDSCAGTAACTGSRHVKRAVMNDCVSRISPGNVERTRVHERNETRSSRRQASPSPLRVCASAVGTHPSHLPPFAIHVADVQASGVNGEVEGGGVGGVGEGGRGGGSIACWKPRGAAKARRSRSFSSPGGGWVGGVYSQSTLLKRAAPAAVATQPYPATRK
jgi:hypothetical protein